MHLEVANKVVAALRSGKFKQGKMRLKNCSDEFCVLGVICEVSGLGTWRSIDGSREYLLPNGAVEAAVLPPDVKEWAGMVSCVGGYPNGSLMYDNDTKEKSFEELADFIEKNYQIL